MLACGIGRGATKRAAFLLIVWLVIAGGASGQDVRLRATSWAGPEELEIERRNIAEFERAHPGLQVQFETIPQNYKEKLLTSFAAGTAPDVLLLDAIIVPSLLERGVLLDLMPHCRKHRVDLSRYYQNVLSIARRDARLYAIPKDFTPLVMYYNKDLFDEAGVPYPSGDWTWREFLRTARRLTRDTDGDGEIEQYGTVTYPEPFAWPPWIWSNGGDFLNPSGQQATGYLDSAETVAALEFLADLHRRHHVAPSPAAAASMGEDVVMLYTQRIGMVVSGHWLLPMLLEHIESGQLRVGVAPIPHPAGKELTTVLYAAGWAVSAQTQHPDLAAELAIFLGSAKANRRRMQQRLAIPANRPLAEEVLTEDETGLERVFYQQVPHARRPWGAVVPEFSRVEEIAADAFEQAVIGDEKLHETLHEAALKIDRELGSAQEPRGAKRVRILVFVLAGLVGAGLVAGLCILATRRSRRPMAVAGWSFLAPSLAHVVIFLLVPVIFSLYLAFHRWNIVDPSVPFVGLANFAELLHDGRFWNALGNTAIFSLHVPVAMAFSLAVAMMLNRPLPGVGLLRTLFFLPSISSLVAIAMTWKWLYNSDYGLLNYLLRLVGMEPINWLTSPGWALPAVMIMSVWSSVGYQMVLFLAGLQSIPERLYEAARIDGAGPLRRFWHVTLPMLRPTILFVLVTSMIASWQVFTPIYVMTQGGPMHATDVVVFHIYQSAWEYLRMGYASAMAWVLFVILMIATYVKMKYIGGEEGLYG